jgi:hypothetical protein
MMRWGFPSPLGNGHQCPQRLNLSGAAARRPIRFAQLAGHSSTPASAKYFCQRQTMTIRRHEDDPCAFDDLLWSVSIGNHLLQLQSSLPRFVMFHPRNESRQMFVTEH